MKRQLRDTTPEERRAYLLACLHLAVPMWIERLRRQSWALVRERAEICGGYVAEHGDILEFGSKREPVAEAFNRFAEGMACLAFGPDGVELWGERWQGEHPEMRRAA